METPKKQAKTMGLSGKIFIGLALGIIVGLFMEGVPDIANNYIKAFWHFVFKFN